MSLDERTRKKLSALAQDAHVGLDLEARARIAGTLATQGPGLVRRARFRRSAVRVAAGCVVGSLLGWAALRSLAPEPALLTARVEKPAVVVPAVAPAACATRARVETRTRPSSDDALLFELGELGSVAAAPGTQLWIDTEDACNTRVKLHDGRVSVHARDLGGGDLRVVTALGDVVVHGTVFAVELQAQSLLVDVAQGRVSVEQNGRALAPPLLGGQRMRMRSGEAARIERLPAEARAGLQQVLQLAGDEHAAPAAAPQRVNDERHERGTDRAAKPAALLEEADALWRAGDIAQARERYRHAGSTHSATSEAAWLALARRELSAGNLAQARDALRAYRSRFPQGQLMGEALGISFRTALAQHDTNEARRTALLLQKRFAGTPQAQAAASWLKAAEAP